MERRVVVGWRARQQAEHEEALRDLHEAPANYIVTGRKKQIPVWQFNDRVWARESKDIYRPVFGPERALAKEKLRQLRLARVRERNRERGHWKPKTDQQWARRRATAKRGYVGMTDERRQQILANARSRYQAMDLEDRRKRCNRPGKAFTQKKYRSRLEVRSRYLTYMKQYNDSNRERLAKMKRDARASESQDEREQRLEVGRIYSQLLNLSGLRKRAC